MKSGSLDKYIISNGSVTLGGYKGTPIQDDYIVNTLTIGSPGSSINADAIDNGTLGSNYLPNPITAKDNTLGITVSTHLFVGGTVNRSTITADGALNISAGANSYILGNLGIGITSPLYKLDVVGGHIRSQYGVIASTLVFNGFSTANQPTGSVGMLY